MALSPIFCNNCGTANIASAKFCSKCGNTLQIGANAPTFDVQRNSPGGTGLLISNTLLKQRYRILASLGSGGMGAVYKAEDTQFGNRLVAVKEMRQSGMYPQEVANAAQQFREEAITLARLKHPSLPSIYDHFSENNRWYLVMDYIEGTTLKEHLEKASDKKLSPLEATEIGIQLCKVLEYLHTRPQPIIFRDLKPANIMLTPDGHLYLIDFGIVRLFKPGQTKDTNAYGSMGYAPPEQFGRAQTTPQSDIYSLGATLHQALSGNDPSLAPFRFAPLNFPGQPALSGLALLIMQMIEMDENKRPKNVGSIRQVLESLKDQLKQPTASSLPPTQYIAPPPPPPPQQSYTPPPPTTYQYPAQGPQAQTQVAKPKGNAWGIGKQQLIGALIGLAALTLFDYLVDLPLVRFSYDNPLFLTFFDSPYAPSWDGILISLVWIIPVFFGCKFGPWVGLVVALVGYLVGDTLSGFISAYTFLWYIYLAAAILGFLSGIPFIITRGRYNNAGSILIAVVFGFGALLIINLITTIGNALHFEYGSSTIFSDNFPLFISFLISNIIGLLLLPILLIVYNVVAKQIAAGRAKTP